MNANHCWYEKTRFSGCFRKKTGLEGISKCHLVLLSSLRQDQLYLNYSLLIFVLLKNLLNKTPVMESVSSNSKKIAKVYQFSLWLNCFEMLMNLLPIILMEKIHLGNCSRILTVFSLHCCTDLQRWNNLTVTMLKTWSTSWLLLMPLGDIKSTVWWLTGHSFPRHSHSCNQPQIKGARKDHAHPQRSEP